MFTSKIKMYLIFAETFAEYIHIKDTKQLMLTLIEMIHQNNVVKKEKGNTFFAMLMLVQIFFLVTFVSNSVYMGTYQFKWKILQTELTHGNFLRTHVTFRGYCCCRCCFCSNEWSKENKTKQKKMRETKMRSIHRKTLRVRSSSLANVIDSSMF